MAWRTYRDVWTKEEEGGGKSTRPYPEAWKMRHSVDFALLYNMIEPIEARPAVPGILSCR
jgi:hypothetical protein